MANSGRRLSNLDLVNQADDFPNPQRNFLEWFAARQLYYPLRVDGIAAPVGIIHPKVVDALRGLPEWRLDETVGFKSVTIDGNDEPSRSKIVADSLSQLRETKRFDVLSRWRDELKPVFGFNNDVLFSVERAAAPLLGIQTPWISKRSQMTANYSGMLDNTVSGGYRTGEIPLETVVREADEEASLPADLVRRLARPCGTISYFHHLDKYVTGEKYLVQPEVEYMYEMLAPEGVTPRPHDDEVEWFQLWDADKIKDGLVQGLFKPSYALVLLDFFIRHDVLDTTNEPDYIEISSRLRRTLEFPTRRDA
ncbi:hypothetical protein QBC34DRAFT_467274 [Podospora aff. communis PSN243]|uniref:Nudix hydrolase domain-containing protein n=1 Tax=Podospora aff. communis PSN243 TaxID=3040156 RepID=A0AAV9GHC0_9PEZI|nr:hypothetical protein QBC34DRAFT_467274 [Podospora aff. communis PSN243]